MKLILGGAGIAVFAGVVRSSATKEAEATRPVVGSGPLAAYTMCKPIDEVQIVAVDRLPGTGTRHRSVATAAGSKSVSMVDGYRVLFADPGGAPFANVKVERSSADEYPHDRENVVAHLAFLSGGTPVARKAGIVDYYAIDNPTRAGAGPVSVHVLFEDATQTIITIYFLGDQRENNDLKNSQEYLTARGAFSNGYGLCVQAAREQQRNADSSRTSP